MTGRKYQEADQGRWRAAGVRLHSSLPSAAMAMESRMETDELDGATTRQDGAETANMTQCWCSRNATRQRRQQGQATPMETLITATCAGWELANQTPWSGWNQCTSWG
jgi:hypothetical protein